MSNQQQYLNAYIEAINKIDDHFEYANKSSKDREFVQKTLSELSEDIKKITEQKQCTHKSS